MKNKLIKISTAALMALSIISCNHNDWFERDSQTIITDAQVWKDPNLILGLLANYYDRLPTFHGVFDTGGMCQLDDAMWSGHTDANASYNELTYGNSYGRYWDYTLIRDINLGMENLETYGSDINENQKKLFMAEFRFIRAFVYFEHVKRMGGVPLLIETLEYDFNGDPSYLQMPRAKEVAIYDFIYTELEEIKEDLAANNSSQTRANTYTALALESRAMLYAASIAKYNNLMATPIQTDGGEVGIPADRTDEFYRKSLTASKTIIEQSARGLYKVNSNKGENFYDMLNIKDSNVEVIFAKDYTSALKTHRFAYDNIAKSMTEDTEGSSTISPSLSFVESFEFLDGSEGTLKDKDDNGNYIVYNNLEDIFANKDGRLYGTVLYPGATFKGTTVKIQAGIAIWNGSGYDFSTTEQFGSTYTDGGIWTGQDGPYDGASYITNTGFYIRKFVSDAPGASTRGTAAINWWPWFRMGEIYLNAAEAAFELNDETSALGYVNAVRERAGFPENSLSSLTMEKIRNERRVELAFEDQRYFDLKRWRIAHEVWDGDYDDDNAMVHGLYPYRIIREGHEDHNKYIFVRVLPTRFKLPRYFKVSNYYASLPSDALSNNPLLVKNPYH